MPRRVWMGLALFAMLGSWNARGIEERIRGILEKTAKAGACAQIKDALNEIYYVIKTPAAEKACAPLLGQRVVLAGVVEQRAGDEDYFLKLKKAGPYRPRLPSAIKPAGPSTDTSIPLPPPPPKKTSPAKRPQATPQKTVAPKGAGAKPTPSRQPKNSAKSGKEKSQVKAKPSAESRPPDAK